MFTGIIESCGSILGIRPDGEGKILEIGCDLDLSDTRIGDSIAVNGACVTAVSLGKSRFSVDMAPETVSRTTFNRMTRGSRVNIERAMKLSGRIDGHLVSGHIDGTGRITAIQKESNAVIVGVAVAKDLAMDMIEKGSVAIDGISLTINQVADDGFEVSIIPHTFAMTTIGFKQVGDLVNIETDMIGKYVRKFVTAGRQGSGDGQQPSTGISMATLAKNGFL